MTKQEFSESLLRMEFETLGPQRFAKVANADRQFIVVEFRSDGRTNCGLYTRFEEETPDEAEAKYAGSLTATPEQKHGPGGGYFYEDALSFITEKCA